MAQFSVKIMRLTGSVLGENQQTILAESNPTLVGLTMCKEVEDLVQQRKLLFLLVRNYDFDNGKSEVNARPQAIIENDHERRKVVFLIGDEFIFKF